MQALLVDLEDDSGAAVNHSAIPEIQAHQHCATGTLAFGRKHGIGQLPAHTYEAQAPQKRIGSREIPRSCTLHDVTFEDKERSITVGAIGPGSILLVVHTFYEEHNKEVIRVISARAAESHERRVYAEAHKGAEVRDPGYRRKKR